MVTYNLVTMLALDAQPEKINSEHQFLSGDSIFILDLVRVIACEMVVIGHAIMLYFIVNKEKINSGDPILKLLDFIASNLGPNGVVLFFFMSGIVISNSLFKKLDNKKYGFFDYFIDRFSRIYSGLVPCLIVILLVGFLINYICPDVYSFVSAEFKTGLSLYGVFGSLLMLQAFPVINPPIPPFASPIWTLNIEWWLYMSFGWLVIMSRKITGLNPLALLILGVFAFFPLYKFFAADHNLILIWFSGVLITLAVMNYKTLSNIFNNKDWIGKINLGYIATGLAVLIVLRVISNYLRNYSTYDTSLEILLGLLILILVIKYNGKTAIKLGKVKDIVSVMAKFSFTMYLVHLAFEGLVIAMVLDYGLNIHPAIVAFVSIIFANVLSYMIAVPTEMRYKKLSKYLHGALPGAKTWGERRIESIIGIFR